MVEQETGSKASVKSFPCEVFIHDRSSGNPFVGKEVHDLLVELKRKRWLASIQLVPFLPRSNPTPSKLVFFLKPFLHSFSVDPKAL